MFAADLSELFKKVHFGINGGAEAICGWKIKK